MEPEQGRPLARGRNGGWIGDNAAILPAGRFPLFDALKSLDVHVSVSQVASNAPVHEACVWSSPWKQMAVQHYSVLAALK